MAKAIAKSSTFYVSDFIHQTIYVFQYCQLLCYQFVPIGNKTKFVPIWYKTKW